MSDSKNNSDDAEVFKPQLIPSSLILDTLDVATRVGISHSRQALLAKQIMAIFDDIKPGEGGEK